MHVLARAARHLATDSVSDSPILNPRWLSDLQARAEALRAHPATGQDAASTLETMSDDLNRRWLQLSAGREGFLTGERWTGLDKVAVAWGDMVCHVNNVMYNRYAESGRVNWITSFASHAPLQERQQWLDIMSPRGIGLILRSIRTDYKLPITYPDKITVIHKLARRPTNTSTGILLDAVMYSERHRRVAARCFEDIAVYDYRAGRVSTMKPFMVDALQEVWHLQEEKRCEVEEEIGRMDRFVEEMEGRR
ncbi:hypothetical protein E4U21_001605 [Claviceps maximensis]|nr:hypothetical protein E4U21_001605 [Claviceps maximensis]